MCDGSRRYTRGVSGPLDTCNRVKEKIMKTSLYQNCVSIFKKPIGFCKQFQLKVDK